MKEWLKTLWGSLADYPQSFDDYYTVGRWLIYKKLVVLLALALLAAGSIAGWQWLKPKKPDAIPVFHEAEERLAAYSGEAVILDEQDDILYRGQIAAGLRDGKGRQYDPVNGRLVYEGAFAQDVYSGHGVLYHDDILLYEGDFANGKFEGEGMLCQGDDLLYHGDFSGGDYHGKGTLYRKGKPVYEGDFAKGLYDGQGTLWDEMGVAIYTGGFSRGLYEGEGMLCAPDGAVLYEGHFRKGLYDGQGRLYSPDGERMQVEGMFRKGLPGISGSLYNARGQLLYSGELYSGRVDYAALNGLAMLELQKRAKETPVVYFGNGYVGYLYRELSFAVVARYDYTEFQEPYSSDLEEETAWEQFARLPSALTADLLLVDGTQFFDRLPQEGALVERKTINGFEKFMASRLAGLEDTSALLNSSAKVLTRGARLYEVMDLPDTLPIAMQGILNDDVYYLYESDGLNKGGVPRVIFCRYTEVGG